MDFTIKTYCKFLDALQKQGFAFQTFAGFIEKPVEKVIILRQDVDRLPENSLFFARIQAERGIRGSFYFRAVPESWDQKIIREIYELGHEVGYHYEELGVTAQRLKGMKAEEEIINLAIEDFKENLSKLRKLVPVITICMHGSPLSKWDSRLLWKYYDYRDFGLIGEPYFDVDFNEVLYLTDTGRKWDGKAFSIRDKAIGDIHLARSTGHRAQIEIKNPYKDWEVQPIKYRSESTDRATSNKQQVTQNLEPGTLNLEPGTLNLEPRTSNLEPRTSSNFHSTFDIIKAAETGNLPPKLMLTFHPQRWTDKPDAWLRELVWQNIKNPAKYFLIKFNNGITK